MLTEKSTDVAIWSHVMYASAKEAKEITEFGISSIKVAHERIVMTFKIKNCNYFESAAKRIPNVYLVTLLITDF